MIEFYKYKIIYLPRNTRFVQDNFIIPISRAIQASQVTYRIFLCTINYHPLSILQAPRNLQFIGNALKYLRRVEISTQNSAQRPIPTIYCTPKTYSNSLRHYWPRCLASSYRTSLILSFLPSPRPFVRHFSKAERTRQRFQDPSCSRENRIIFLPRSLHLSRRCHARSSSTFSRRRPTFPDAAAPSTPVPTIFSRRRSIIYKHIHRCFFCPFPALLSRGTGTRGMLFYFNCSGVKETPAGF